MVEKRNCSFCGEPIEPGTGKMYVKKDATVFLFCSNKCKKNRIDLGRVPRRTRWTVRYAELKASTLQRKKAKDTPDKDKTEEKPKSRPVAKKKAPVKATPKSRPVPKKAAPKKEAPPAPPTEEAEPPAS